MLSNDYALSALSSLGVLLLRRALPGAIDFHSFRAVSRLNLTAMGSQRQQTKGTVLYYSNRINEKRLKTRETRNS